MKNEFDYIEIPEEALNYTIRKSMDKLYKRHRTRRNKKIFSGISASAATILLICLYLQSNPTFASNLPLIGHLFEIVEEKQVFSGEISEYAEPLPDPYSQTDNGITITISEIYCNSEGIYLSAMIQSEEPFPENRLEVYPEDYVSGVDFIDFRCEGQIVYDFTSFPGEVFDLRGNYIDAHTFVGGTRLWPLSKEIPEEFHMDISLDTLNILCEREQGESLKSQGTMSNVLLTGKWEYSLDVSANKEGTIIKELNQVVPNQNIITTVKKTPLEIVINVEGASDKEFMSEEDEIYTYVVYDADGNYMSDKAGVLPIGEHNVSHIDIYFYSQGTKNNQTDKEIQGHMNEQWTKDWIKENAIQHIRVDF